MVKMAMLFKLIGDTMSSRLLLLHEFRCCHVSNWTDLQCMLELQMMVVLYDLSHPWSLQRYGKCPQPVQTMSS